MSLRSQLRTLQRSEDALAEQIQALKNENTRIEANQAARNRTREQWIAERNRHPIESREWNQWQDKIDASLKELSSDGLTLYNNKKELGTKERQYKDTQREIDDVNFQINLLLARIESGK